MEIDGVAPKNDKALSRSISSPRSMKSDQSRVHPDEHGSRDQGKAEAGLWFRVASRADPCAPDVGSRIKLYPKRKR